MAGWHHGPSEHEFKQTLGDSGGQRSLVSCKELQRVGESDRI